MHAHTYPDSFITACTAEFPLANEFHHWLAAHDKRVGKFLQQARNDTPTDVRIDLFRAWCSIVNRDEDSGVIPI